MAKPCSNGLQVVTSVWKQLGKEGASEPPERAIRVSFKRQMNLYRQQDTSSENKPLDSAPRPPLITTMFA